MLRLQGSQQRQQVLLGQLVMALETHDLVLLTEGTSYFGETKLLLWWFQARLEPDG